ncbi:MAG: DUF3368 domain-containing protein [Vicinamibacterales bacterium]
MTTRRARYTSDSTQEKPLPSSPPNLFGPISFLIDERAGRKVAHARGLPVRGTLGVLVQARQSELLPALKPVLDALVADGFRIAPALIREALAHVEEA